MIKNVKLLFIIIILLYLTLSQIICADKIKRFALFIGANNGGKERTRLRYAQTDALSVANVFKAIGGINNEDLMFLAEPKPLDIENAFIQFFTMNRPINTNFFGRQYYAIAYGAYCYWIGFLRI